MCVPGYYVYYEPVGTLSRLYAASLFLIGSLTVSIVPSSSKRYNDRSSSNILCLVKFTRTVSRSFSKPSSGSLRGSSVLRVTLFLVYFSRVWRVEWYVYVGGARLNGTNGNAGNE